MVNIRQSGSLLAVLLATAATTIAGDDLARRVLVVYNESEPESKPLAEYYAQRRGVPTNQICAIRARNAETITRREYNEQVREPILRFMNDRGLLFQLPATVNGVSQMQTYDNKIMFLAPVYGVPLRIEDDSDYEDKDLDAKAPRERRRTDASVDSELTWLPTPNVRLSFVVPNPFFNKSPAVFDQTLNNAMLLVARLDGPDPKIVRRMIDDALAAERIGLLGRAYFDARDNQEAGYAEGDKWIKQAAQYLRDAGFETVLDDQPTVFGEDFPMTDAAVYAGWYTPVLDGPFKRADFKFRLGAVAYHLHSLSAYTMRTRTDNWAAPLLACGAAASFGNVYEPYLSMTPHVDLFFKRLLDGATFAEAGWYSQPALSWQTTFVGDPLYRPFPRTIDGQIALLEAEKNPSVAWAYLRKINVLLNSGDFRSAEKLCAEKATTLRSRILTDKLAALKAARQKKK